MSKIVLFDGECLFCNRSVRFIIERDPKAVFSFASLQSSVGQEMLKNYQIPNDLDSLILIDQSGWYSQSTAALQICKELKWGWKLFAGFLLVPASVRDRLYDWFASHRYQWFSKQINCPIPSPEIRQRFLS